MRARGKTLGTFIAVLVVAALTASPALAEDKSDLAGRVKVWQEAFNAGNVDAIAAGYTKNAIRLPYQAPAMEGRTAIAANVKQNYDEGITRVELEVLGAEAKGSRGWGHGTYRLMNAEGETVQEGKWMNVSQKVDGTWLIQGDIWNTNAPE